MNKFAFCIMSAALLVGLCSCVTIPMKEAEGNFEISITPLSEGGEALYPSVYVDGKFIGHATPRKPILYLKRGRHTIRVELDGYEIWEERIVLLGAPSQQVLHVQLKRSSAD